MANRSKSGEWLEPVEVVTPASTPRRSNILSQEQDNMSPVPDTPRSRVRDTDTEFVKIAKGGGHKGLLDITPHQPTSSPKQYEKKSGEWCKLDLENNNDPPPTPRSKAKDTDTKFLKIAKEGGHKDLLVIENHKPTSQAVNYKKNGGDWYQHKGLESTPHERPIETPRSRAKRTDTNYVKTAKDGGHKDLLTMNEHKRTPTAMKYKKDTGNWFVDDKVDGKEAFKRDISTPASARVHRNYNKLQVKNTDTAFIKIAKRGGHSDLLKMPDNTRSVTPVKYDRKCDWFWDNKNIPERPKTASRSRTMESSVLSPRMEELARPRTAYRASNPIWVGGSGPEVRASPARRHLSMDSGFSPYALHTGAGSMTSRNPDKI